MHGSRSGIAPCSCAGQSLIHQPWSEGDGGKKKLHEAVQQRMISDVDGCTVRWASFGWARLRCTYSGLDFSARTCAIAQRQITNPVIGAEQKFSNYLPVQWDLLQYEKHWHPRDKLWKLTVFNCRLRESDCSKPKITMYVSLRVYPPASLATHHAVSSWLAVARACRMQLNMNHSNHSLKRRKRGCKVYTYFIQQYGQRASLSVQCTLGNTLNILEASVCILKRAKRAYKSSLAVIYKIHKKIFQPAHLHIFFSSG